MVVLHNQIVEIIKKDLVVQLQLFQLYHQQVVVGVELINLLLAQVMGQELQVVQEVVE